MNLDILNKFTTHLKNAIARAAAFALELNSPRINPEHLLYGLILQKGSIGAEILSKAGLKAENLRTSLVGERIMKIATKKGSLKFSKNAKRSLEKAALIASEYKHKYVGTEHLLSILIRMKDEKLKQIFEENKINIESLKEHLKVVLKSTSRFPDLTNVFRQSKRLGNDESFLKETAFTPSPALELFCTDLTDANLQKDIDPVIGRTEELERLIHILSRRTKNNPVLIGDPGVGKTAIVEGLAKKILKKEVPDVLLNKKILKMDLSLVIAGTIYRGEFEGRIKQIIEEIKADLNIILFIDELHTIIGAGSTTGTMDAANILKPALAKGEIRCIGATTLDEYRKHIESDAALERRFQPILIAEPTPEETIEVLEGIKDNYEKYHKVKITHEAIAAAIDLSVRYIQDKFLPDKAIDLIDEASSKMRVSRKGDILSREIKKLEKDLLPLTTQKQEAVKQENFEQAVVYKNQEYELHQKLGKLKEKQFGAREKPIGAIKKEHIAEIISRITRIPLTELLKEEKERLLNLEKLLNRKIIGQEEAISTVANFIRRARVGLSHPARPLGSFIFLGPSGVGKTETAKVISQTIFKSEDALIRIDMSEFAESFNISKLIGAPAGYVGYKEGAKLTDSVKRKPYSVVLFDEIEKAHPEVFNLLLQVLEDGHLTDATGKKINFKNTIIIMTSNVGNEFLNKGAALGFKSKKEVTQKKAQEKYDEIKSEVLKNLEKRFRPEFLNRVDKIIVFKPLSEEAIGKIIKLQIKELEQRLVNQKIRIKITPKIIKLIAKKGFSPDQGARAIRRVIQEEIENFLAQRILQNEFREGDTIEIDALENKIVLNKK